MSATDQRSTLGESLTDVVLKELNKVDAALDEIPAIRRSADSIQAALPWLIITMAVVGVGLILVATSKK